MGKKLPFRLKVDKYKCGECDLIFLVEKASDDSDDNFCPRCTSCMEVEKMDEIMIIQEEENK